MSPIVIKTGPQNQPARASRNFTDNEDAFSIGQAFQDWFQLIVSPRVFCEEQEGAGGMLSPLALLMAYALLFGALYLVILFAWQARLGMGAIFALFLVVLVVPLTWLGYTVICLLFGGVLHLVSRLFQGESGYSSSFRAAVYAVAPVALLSGLAGLLTLAFLPSWAGSRSGENIYQVWSNMIGGLWGLILLGMSIRATQRLSVGGAIGTTVVGCGLFVGLFWLVGQAIYSLLAGG